MKCKYEGSGWAEGRCMGTKEIDPCPGYEKCDRFKPDYKTNADHIRSLGDEELAEWMEAHNVSCGICSEYVACGGEVVFGDTTCDCECAMHYLDWLKQPYQEDSE